MSDLDSESSADSHEQGLKGLKKITWSTTCNRVVEKDTSELNFGIGTARRKGPSLQDGAACCVQPHREHGHAQLSSPPEQKGSAEIVSKRLSRTIMVKPQTDKIIISEK